MKLYRQTFRFLMALPVFLGFSIPAAAELLRFRHETGLTYRVMVDVEQSVLVNGQPVYRADVQERAVLETLEVADDGSALLSGDFRILELISGLPGYREWSQGERIAFRRDVQGRLEIPEEADMPVLRDIPSFPASSVHPGDRWSMPAWEVHVFNLTNGTAGPYKVPFSVHYEYLRDEWTEGRKIAVIDLTYDMFHPIRERGEPIKQLAGRSQQTLRWDLSSGRTISRTEDFEFLVILADGTMMEFIGGQTTLVTVVSPFEVERRILAEKVEDSGLKDVRVLPGEGGVVLALDDVLFPPDSAELFETERLRLEVLRSLLKDYASRDMVITGHTALAGSPEGRRRLSLERAKTVAEILFPEGRSAGQGRLWLDGVGAQDPKVEENSEADRARNRRVEILILDG